MMLSIVGVIIVTIVLAFAGFLSAVNAAESMEEFRGKKMKVSVLLVYILINAIFGLFFGIAHPALYAIILLILGVLQATNREGKKRRASWNALAIAYSIVLILSTVAYFERNGKPFSGWALLIAIPILLPFIVGLIQTHRLEKATKKDRRTINPEIYAWIVVLVLIIILTIQIINLTMGR